MKKMTLFVLLLACVALAANAASAALVVSSAALGSDSADPGANVSTTVTLTNTGATTITGITMSSTAGASYSIGFVGVPSSLAPGASAPVTVNGILAKNTDAVNGALDASPVTIGDITASGTESGSPISGSNTLTAQVGNKLEIKKVYITINGEDEKSLEDGDEVKDLKPGDQLDIRVLVENKFSDDDDIDMEDITVRAVVDDSDFDLDEDDDISDISSDDEDDVTFSNIAVDDEASGTYKLEVEVEGRGESPFSGRHGQKVEIDLKVDRESHEISIKSASLSPSILACDVHTFDAKAKLFNSGKDDEDEVAIEVAIPSLGVSVVKDAIELDESDETTRTVSVTLPSTTKAGTYNVDIISYWNTDSESDRKSLSLKVDACAAPAPTPTPTPAPTPTPTPTPSTGSTGSTGTTTVKARASESFLDSPAGITALIVGILAAVVIIIVFITMLAKPKAK